MKRILVTGSRHWADVNKIEHALREHGPGIVVHGDARGADDIAAEVAHRLGWPTEAHPADWTNGRRGGPERNQKMVDLGADVCLAFPREGSVGTYDCIARAKRAGIRVVVVPAFGLDEDEIDNGIIRAEDKIAKEVRS